MISRNGINLCSESRRINHQYQHHIFTSADFLILQRRYGLSKKIKYQQRNNTQIQPDKHPQLTEARRTLLAISDAQILIAIAFGFNFMTESKCSMTTYHFGVALDTVLICCSTMAFSLSMCRDFWKAPFSALIRVVLSTIVFSGLGAFIFYEKQGGHFPNWPPGSDQSDFLILLPAGCLEDSDLFAGLGNSSNGPPADILHLDNLSSRSFMAMFGVVAAVYLIALVIPVLRCCWCCGRAARIDVSRRNKFYFLARLSWLLLRLAPVVIACICWRDIHVARGYVDDSGWMVPDNGKNPELDVNSISQVLAILTALWFIVLLLDTVKRSRKGKYQEGHEKV
jgi:hypothetical protein